MIISTLTAMTAGYVLGMIFGVPKAISARRLYCMLCEWLAPRVKSKYQDTEDGMRAAGAVFLCLLLLMTVLPVAVVLVLLYIFFPVGAIILDALICWSVLDIKGISNMSYIASRSINVSNEAKSVRYAEMLSGEDCRDFTVDECAKATIQGIADRTVDSLTAPLFCMALLSGAGALICTAANSASFVIDKKYGESEAFGDASRGLRDVICFLPGKLAAVIMLVDALFLKMNVGGAERIYKNDRRKCARTAFGGCRAVLAGVFGISLLPEEVYSEQFLRTFTIGEQLKDPDGSDVFTALQLMLGTVFIIMMLFFVVKLTLGVYL